MSAVATKPRAASAKKAPALVAVEAAKPSAIEVHKTATKPEATEPFWVAPTVLARNTVEGLLDRVHGFDLAEDDSSNYALRLVSVASEMVSRQLYDDTTLSMRMARNCVAGIAFDAYALLNASLHYPGEPIGPERTPLIRHALLILDRLADFHCYGTEADDPGGAEVLPALLEAIGSYSEPQWIPLEIREQIGEAWSRFTEAQDVISLIAMQPVGQTALVSGTRALCTVLDPLYDALAQTNTPTEQAVNAVNAVLSDVIGVLGEALQDLGSQALWGAYKLLETSQDGLNDVLPTLMAIERAAKPAGAQQ